MELDFHVLQEVTIYDMLDHVLGWPFRDKLSGQNWILIGYCSDNAYLERSGIQLVTFIGTFFYDFEVVLF